jgi:hypothetical protein
MKVTSVFLDVIARYLDITSEEACPLQYGQGEMIAYGAVHNSGGFV